MDWKSKITSRKFILAVVTALLIIANKGLDLNLPEDAINTIVLIILGYIGVEGAVDVVRAFKGK